MTLKTLASAATLLLALSPLSIASAQSKSSTDDTIRFETVDSYELKSAYWIKITGIVSGEATPRTLELQADFGDTYNQYLRACERMALMAMSKPGQYYLDLQSVPYAGTYLTSCKLTRR